MLEKILKWTPFVLTFISQFVDLLSDFKKPEPETNKEQKS